MKFLFKNIPKLGVVPSPKIPVYVRPMKILIDSFWCVFNDQPFSSRMIRCLFRKLICTFITLPIDMRA